MEVDPHARIRAAIVNSRDLPTVPVALGRILSVVADEGASRRDLIEIVEEDQALTARILRVANSPFFGLARQIGTLSRAVMVLGFSTVRDLALGAHVFDAFGGAGADDMRRLWTHAGTVATLARELGRRVPGADPGEAFTAGLLHDVGRAVLFLHYPDAGTPAPRPDAGQTLATERAIYGVDHATVGDWIARSWRLPEPIAETARTHHEPLGDEPAIRRTPALVNLCNALAPLLDPEGPEGPEDDTRAPAAAEILARLPQPPIAPSEWGELAGLVRTRSRALAQLMGGRS